MFSNNYKGKNVLVTGDTGFKGSWLSIWLKLLGANVYGYANNVPTEPSNFESCKLDKLIKHKKGDINDIKSLTKLLKSVKPDVIFHLAAQALVSESFQYPLNTFETNTFGSIKMLESVRQSKIKTSIVMITSDKVYENMEWEWGYREQDRLGGSDPYSASKSMAEIAIQSYIKSFLDKNLVKVATARAGNVIGGGDWANNRIVPDIIRAWSNKKKVMIRNPYSTRPWQHVLEPLSGYLLLGSKLQRNKFHAESFNFGPNTSTHYSVNDLLISMSNELKNMNWVVKKNINISESKLLQLNCDKSSFLMNWRPTLEFSEVVEFTTDWYKEYYLKMTKNMFQFSLRQIIKYSEIAKNRNLQWTK